MNRPTNIGQINTKPFWKEPSLKHVWARANDGAKMMCYAMLYVIFTAIVARAVGEFAALWVLGMGIGFVVGWAVCDLYQPIEKDSFECQAIEFDDIDSELLMFEHAITELEEHLKERKLK